MSSGPRYPNLSASTPHTHSKMNMPRPNIESVMPICPGLACSWRSSSGIAIRVMPVATDDGNSPATRAQLRLRRSRAETVGALRRFVLHPDGRDALAGHEVDLQG